MMRRIGAVALLALTFTVPLLAQHRMHAVSGLSGKSISDGVRGQSSMQTLTFESIHPRLRSEVGVVVSGREFRQPQSWFGELAESVEAMSVSGLYRRWFGAPETSRYYFEVLGGPMYAERQVPSKTARLNFVTEFGTGFVLHGRAQSSPIVGVRFSHVSNGGLSERNPGWNVTSLLVGYRFR